MDLPSAMSPSICLREKTTSERLTCFVGDISNQLCRLYYMNELKSRVTLKQEVAAGSSVAPNFATPTLSNGNKLTNIILASFHTITDFHDVP